MSEKETLVKVAAKSVQRSLKIQMPIFLLCIDVLLKPNYDLVSFDSILFQSIQKGHTYVIFVPSYSLKKLSQKVPVVHVKK